MQGVTCRILLSRNSSGKGRHYLTWKLTRIFLKGQLLQVGTQRQKFMRLTRKTHTLTVGQRQFRVLEEIGQSVRVLDTELRKHGAFLEVERRPQWVKQPDGLDYEGER